MTPSGIEPLTFRLQRSASTNWATAYPQAYFYGYFISWINVQVIHNTLWINSVIIVIWKPSDCARKFSPSHYVGH
jgi:hypothetical protein